MLDELVAALNRSSWYRNQIVHVDTVAGSRPEFSQVELPEPLQDYLDQRKIALYRHQRETLDALKDGKDVILTTPTASGKTLAFNLPIAAELLRDPTATALYIYPLKALANDQLKKLLDLEQATGISLLPRTYDGDTPTGQRARIKKEARIVLTNPHALHHYLPWHYQWERFFKHLRYVVIDEAHSYRGLFGSNVAMLLRRLFRILRHYGASPQLVLSSASIGNPAEFARALTGRPAVSISEDTSGRGAKHVLFWDANADPDHSITTQAAQLLADLSSLNLQTLCFVRSRALAEVIAQLAQEQSPNRIVSYRAGYLPHERREIEEAFREREIEGVVSTSALEAGIDIGSLDAAILVGFPGSLLAAWQQAGRAGRGTDPSLVVFMPYDDPLDRHFLRHPDHFLGKERERLVIRTDNPHLRASHLACAASELPVQPKEIRSEERDLLQSLAQKGLLAETPRGYVYRGLRRAHDLFALDDLSGESVKLMCAGELLETMDRLRACRDAYPGAVLLHRGETYVVEQLDLEKGIARARREDVDYYTKNLRAFIVEILATEQAIVSSPVPRARGRVRVTESFTGYKTLHFNRTVSVDPLDLPPHTYETDGLWVTFPSDIKEIPTASLLGGLHGAEHALIAMAPLLVLCDRDDIAGLSTPLHPQTTCPTILIFDEIENGAGLTEVLFSSFARLAKRAHRLVADCSCKEGCPSCLLSPRCGSHNRPLDKTASVHVLSLLSSEGEVP